MERAREDAEQRHRSEVGVREGAHRLGQQRAVRVAARDRLRCAVRPRDLGALPVGRGGEDACHDVQQLGQADPPGGGDRDDRVEVPGEHRPRQVVEQLVLGGGFAEEVGLHQRLVLALGDDGLDEFAVGHGGIPEADPAATPGVGPGEDRVRSGRFPTGGGDRQVQGEDAGTEGPGALRQHPLRVSPPVVELGDDHRSRCSGLGALPPQPRGRLVHTAVGAEDEQGGVGGAEPGPDLAEVVRVARGVHEVDVVVAVAERRDREADGPPLLAGRRVLVGDGGALVHRTRPGDGAGGREQGLDESGLPAARRADEDDVADPCGVHRRGGGPPTLSRSPVCHRPHLRPVGRARPAGCPSRSVTRRAGTNARRRPASRAGAGAAARGGPAPPSGLPKRGRTGHLGRPRRTYDDADQVRRGAGGLAPGAG